MKNLEDLEGDFDDDIFEDKTDEEIISSFKTFSSQKLADIIVSHRYLGFFKNFYEKAMEELSSRRVAGDNFDFESYIEENLKSLPKISFDIKNFSQAISQIKSGIK